MTGDEGAAEPIYTVVVNHEQQYSLWPADRRIPPGWSDAGMAGTRRECLDYINQVWVDLRPRGVREESSDGASEG